MGVYALKPAFRRALSPIGRALVSTGVSPDTITIAGLIFASISVLGIWLGRAGGAWLLLVPAGALLRTVANALDGWVAQQTGSSRPRGEVLNETADRLGDAAVFLPLLLVPGVPDELLAITVAAMLVTSYLGVAVKAAGGARVYAGVMGKPDRMLVAGLAGVIAMFRDPGEIFTIALWVVLVGCTVTFIQRALLARRQL